MQKTNRLALAVLALLGTTTAAFAQSSVTLYGRVNTTVERQEVGNVKTTGLFNNSSRFGFKGSEDLGGGLKAGFQLESGFNSDTGASATTFFGRQSEVNLSGGFGAVRLGRFTAESYYATADYVSMHNHDTGSSSDAFYAYVMPDANKIAYRTPTFGGLTVDAAVALHGVEHQAKGQDQAGQRRADHRHRIRRYVDHPAPLLRDPGLGEHRPGRDQVAHRLVVRMVGEPDIRDRHAVFVLELAMQLHRILLLRHVFTDDPETGHVGIVVERRRERPAPAARIEEGRHEGQTKCERFQLVATDETA